VSVSDADGPDVSHADGPDVSHADSPDVSHADGPELVIGLVTPIGTNTAALAESVTGALSAFGYTPILIKVSELIPGSSAPIGEFEDDRVRRLIAAGDAFCQEHVSSGHQEGDPAALARLAVREIQRRRLLLKRQDGADPSPEDIVDQIADERPRTAYILHSLKRPTEVQLLRRIYGEQFFLIGSQTTVQQREDDLLRRTLPPGTDAKRRAIAQDLIRLDANEQSPIGQKVNDTYPLADFFLREADASRVIELIFGETIPPTVDEYAMYVARASRARSLAASRKVGAAIVVGDAVVASGYNDVPHGQKTDVLAGVDTSERLKQDNVLDTIRRLRQNGLLNDNTKELGDDALAHRALEALKGGELLGVIEYQRAVHAEARAIDDATMRGVSPVGGTLYVTTYPCHLCYKHALSVRLASIQYIEPYPKSRAVAMYPTEREDQLVPYAGVAPRRYVQVFDDRPAPVSDPSGTFVNTERSVANPLLGAVRNDADRDFEERLAVAGLKEQYR
jgi:cytidine deaminase